MVFTKDKEIFTIRLCLFVNEEFGSPWHHRGPKTKQAQQTFNKEQLNSTTQCAVRDTGGVLCITALLTQLPNWTHTAVYSEHTKLFTHKRVHTSHIVRFYT